MLLIEKESEMAAGHKHCITVHSNGEIATPHDNYPQLVNIEHETFLH